MKYTLSLAERETTIRFDMETMEATIDSAIPSVVRLLDKLTAAYPDTYELIRDDPDFGARRYRCPAKYIRFGRPASEATKEAARRNSSKSRFKARDTADSPHTTASALMGGVTAQGNGGGP